jgi:hypothetical protein
MANAVAPQAAERRAVACIWARPEACRDRTSTPIRTPRKPNAAGQARDLVSPAEVVLGWSVQAVYDIPVSMPAETPSDSGMHCGPPAAKTHGTGRRAVPLEVADGGVREADHRRERQRSETGADRRAEFSNCGPYIGLCAPARGDRLGLAGSDVSLRCRTLAGSAPTGFTAQVAGAGAQTREAG